MITDKLNTFSAAQDVTASAASTDVLDLGPLTHGNTRRDIGAGEPIYLVVATLVAAAAAGAATDAAAAAPAAAADAAAAPAAAAPAAAAPAAAH